MPLTVTPPDTRQMFTDADGNPWAAQTFNETAHPSLVFRNTRIWVNPTGVVRNVPDQFQNSRQMTRVMAHSDEIFQAVVDAIGPVGISQSEGRVHDGGDFKAFVRTNDGDSFNLIIKPDEGDIAAWWVDRGDQQAESHRLAFEEALAIVRDLVVEAVGTSEVRDVSVAALGDMLTELDKIEFAASSLRERLQAARDQ
ncbi:MAG: hypothetical protein AAF432_00615 [Planctomycetota bacterium]